MTAARQHDQPPLLLGGRTSERLVDPPAVVLHATHHPGQLVPPVDPLL
jgi:hypothetical protein